GPTIKPNEPAPDSAHPSSSLQVKFEVDEAPLNPSDDNAGLDDVSLAINGQDIPGVKEVSSENGAHQYAVNVDPNDSKLFGTKGLDGSTSIAITAKNARGITRTDTYQVIVDGAGPKITITSPKDGTIIGGTQLLEFTVEDMGSGVRKESVKVTVNSDEHVFD